MRFHLDQTLILPFEVYAYVDHVQNINNSFPF